jgi:hypothetical protein
MKDISRFDLVQEPNLKTVASHGNGGRVMPSDWINPFC